MKVWVWLWLVWVAAVGPARGNINLGKTPYCEEGPRILTCDLTDLPDRDAEMQEGNSNTTFDNWIVINATRLVLVEQCQATIQKVTVEFSKSIITKSSSTPKIRNDCSYKLVLQDSQADSISHAAKIIKLLRSEVINIKLDLVEQFDFLNSAIKYIDIEANKDKSTIQNSDIENIRRMVLEGNFHFEVKNSDISNIHNLIFNTSHKTLPSAIRNVRVSRVYTNGLTIAKGPLLMEKVTFETLDSNAFIIKKGKLIISNCKFINVGIDSLILSGGSLEFINVTVGRHFGVSFEIMNGQGGLKPLAFVLDCSYTHWIIGVIFSLVGGIVLGGAVVFIVQRKMKCQNTQDKEKIELLVSDAPLHTKPPDPPKNLLSPSPKPEKPPPPIPADDNYQWYDDVTVTNSVQQEIGSPPVPASRPPLHTNLPPKKSNEEDSNEEPVYEDVCAPDAPQPHNIFSGNAPPLPAQPPGFPHTPSTGLPIPPSGPPPSISEPVVAHTNRSLANVKQDKPKLPKPRPIPPVRNESAPKSPSSLSDERDNLPPPPVPADNGDYYDVSNIQSDTQKAGRRPLPPGKPSFLHTTSKQTTDTGRSPNTGKPTGRGAMQHPKWPPPAKPPTSKTYPNPASATNTYSDDEDIYEEIE